MRSSDLIINEPKAGYIMSYESDGDGLLGLVSPPLRARKTCHFADVDQSKLELLRARPMACNHVVATTVAVRRRSDGPEAISLSQREIGNWSAGKVGPIGWQRYWLEILSLTEWRFPISNFNGKGGESLSVKRRQF